MKDKLYFKREYNDDFIKPLYEKYQNGELLLSEVEPFTYYEVELFDDEQFLKVGENRKNVISENVYFGLVEDEFNSRVQKTKQINLLFSMFLFNIAVIVILTIISLYVEREMTSSLLIFGSITTIFTLLGISLAEIEFQKSETIKDGFDYIEN